VKHELGKSEYPAIFPNLKGFPMRISFTTDVRPKRVAKALKKCAQARGIELKLMAAQDVIAKVYGYRDHRDLMMSIEPGPPPLSDYDLEPNEISERHAFQVKALSQALRIDEQMAVSIIAEIRPNNKRSALNYDAARSFPNVVRNQVEPTVVVVRKSRKFMKGGGDGRRFFDLTRLNTSS
jgi:hypothetical protein